MGPSSDHEDVGDCPAEAWGEQKNNDITDQVKVDWQEVAIDCYPESSSRPGATTAGRDPVHCLLRFDAS